MIKRESYLNFWRELKKYDNYLLTTHINPDGDGICSMILIGMILRSLKKKYQILMENPFPEKFKFLIEGYADYLIPELINVPKMKNVHDLLPANFKPAAAVILDTNNNERLGNFAGHFLNLKTVLIVDHHTGPGKFRVTAGLVDRNASSTGEIIYNLMKYNKFKITKKNAELLYISIFTDTNDFTQSNTSARTHAIVSELLSTGVKVEETHLHIEEQPAEVIRIYGKVISRLELKYNNKLIWSYITKKELQKCPDSNIDGLIEMIRNVKDTLLVVLFKEIDANMTKVCLRGKKGFDVYTIARGFNGGGHMQASGFNYNAGLHAAIKVLIKKFKEYI